MTSMLAFVQGRPSLVFEMFGTNGARSKKSNQYNPRRHHMRIPKLIRVISFSFVAYLSIPLLVESSEFKINPAAKTSSFKQEVSNTDKNSPTISLDCIGTKWDAYGSFLNEFQLTNKSSNKITYSGYNISDPRWKNLSNLVLIP
jgi:hypothetical protein